ncbi:MAG: excinuclease ABC subunit UvrC [Candidatus Hydrogenedentes bacterium]|nr:excinuclease ABC subunit UvrC [Candidatus Hydrogenedentota bacterium]
MDRAREIKALDRLHLAGRPSERKSAEEFVKAFDATAVPTEPGCYIMRDEEDHILYVGKAKNLRARIRAYLNETDSRYTAKFLMSKVADLEFLVTTNEKEALLLENSLIKQYKPRYNIKLRDDKTYVSLRVNVQEDFPRVTVVRRYKKDGARYFGPYSSAQSVRETLRQIQRLFPLRSCTDHVLRNRTRPCLYYQMGQCAAPCVGRIDRNAYHEIVDQVLLVLEGRNAELEKLLLQQIQERAEKLEFEKAAALRDRLYALRRTLERQRTVDVAGAEDRDVFGLYNEGRFTEIQVIFYRGGKMVGGRSFTFKQRELPVEEALSSFLLQYYAAAPVIPQEVLLPLPLEDADTLAEVLTEQRGARVSVHAPQRGEKRALVEIAARNAKSSFEEKRLAEQANKDLLEQVKTALKIPQLPERIECFDISTTQGDKAVGSMVTFEGGVPNKSRYRRFAIRQVEGQDDFAMLREVLIRRFTRAIEEGELPDLVLIDGGKGQLGVATTVLSDLGIEDLPAASIAKSRSLGEGGHSPERFFVPGRMNPIILPQNSPVVHFLARIRDEAHRCAITYHRKRRAQATFQSPLLSIPGVGRKRAKRLLNSFGSLERLRTVSVQEIAMLPGFNEQIAGTILEHVATPRAAVASGGDK